MPNKAMQSATKAAHAAKRMNPVTHLVQAAKSYIMGYGDSKTTGDQAFAHLRRPEPKKAKGAR